MDPSLAVAIVSVCVIVAVLALFCAVAVKWGYAAEAAFLRDRYSREM
ncbi:hypothetical protein QJ043_07240 [Olsenella sp. YH-ols2217]|uniref:LemA family protein n=1 Tax=Kribbibacterium absianum TaxID=3044210 RepID=A0ABT6ZLF0_9ACTN|nr:MULTISPECIES: hypothetical protein [unclassified Olsenella]MDJ1121861.1 hypothetical protein [Olsenella sp. YH-ols2216]MDJ1129869.1 hypothetical protein [Olsenella sp. YH-ols2217]